ncbi:ATP-binding protein [Magnetovibrio sp. PR-2]|uniref:sensor histidine kinase n=1 Tax=Magnetovibrio sp. PR-2 TaxID=3120356 RepID=UPI002FCE50A7
MAAFGFFYALFHFALAYFHELELQRVDNRTSLYRTSLVGALEQFQHLPHVLARDPYVILGADGSDLDALNARLQDFSNSAGLEAIYLMDPAGKTIAASNFDQEVTFLGQNYGFRPYFKAALSQKRGEFFAIGSTTSKPGYFIAEPVLGPRANVTGVIALKVNFAPLTQSWTRGEERALVSNKDGVVVLSSEPKWLYGTLNPITQARMQDIRLERQFGKEKLAPLPWRELGPGTVSLDGQTYLHNAVAVGRLDWTLHLLGDVGRVQERAWFTVITAAIVISLLLVVAFFIRSVRIRDALQASQAARRKLHQTNIELEEAQAELARASKLAALGQLAASVTHELGQPISAMRNYLTAAELDDDDVGDKDLLQRLSAIVVRMENIFQQLRFFAQPREDAFAPINLVDAWTSAFDLVSMDLQMAKIKTNTTVEDPAIKVFANRFRLEQVIVNLLKNAIAALKTCSTRELNVRLYIQDSFAILSVADSGAGLGDKSIEHLQEPFHTTKASGEGMGLGLAISAEIIKEHDGELLAANVPGGGAEFSVKLPLHKNGSSS